MPKTKLSDIFKRGENFKLKPVDFSDPKVRKMLADCKIEQAKCLKRKEVDWNELNKFYITI